MMNHSDPRPPDDSDADSGGDDARADPEAVVYTRSDGESPSQSVVQAVAEATRTDPTRLRPLFEVVDTDALDTALKEGWITRAGLDVTDPEPLPADHPIMRHAPERLVVTPHVGSASIGTRNRMAEMVAACTEAGIEGEPLPHSARQDAGL